MKHFWFFDLDGTLADTDKDIREAWRATLDDLGIACPNFDRDFVAGPPIETMAEILFPGLYTDELGVKLRAGFGDHYDYDGFPNTFEYPGVMDAVRKLKSHGCEVFIATNKRFAGATLMAEKFGWNKVFDFIYAGDMYSGEALAWARARSEQRTVSIEQLKKGSAATTPCSLLPAHCLGKLKKPALLAKILADRGISAADAVMVGDTASDFEAARANGIESVGVTWGYGKPEELALADRLVSDAGFLV